MNDQLVPIAFHGEQIYLVEHEGEPYCPVRPIIDNLGLAWQPQHVKLNAHRKRWGVTMIVTPSKGGGQNTVCIPLRKTASFLLSIDPRKVKPEIKPKLELYQEECDDALWAYWSEGIAVNKRAFDEDNLREIIRLKDLIIADKDRIIALHEAIKRKGSRVSDEEKQRIRDLWAQGYSKHKISELLDRPRSTVRDVLKRAGIRSLREDEMRHFFNGGGNA